MKKVEPLCTVAEAAEILNIDEKTVRRRIKDGALRSIKIGRLRRIDPRDLEDFIRDHRVADCPVLPRSYKQIGKIAQINWRQV